MHALRLAIRVRPGASRPKVGGRYGDALVVAVSAQAVEGAANAAVVKALAAAFDVSKSQVEIVAGATGRNKVVEVRGDRSELERLLAELIDGAPR